MARISNSTDTRMSLLVTLFMIAFSTFATADPNLFNPCERCDCSMIPNTLEGRVVDVSAGSGWKTFSSSSVTNNKAEFLIFRSTNSSCQTEIKINSIVTSLQMVELPQGRSNASVVTRQLAASRWDWCDGPSHEEYLRLGKSIVSEGAELALGFLNPYKDANQLINVTVLHRQRCSATSIVTSGFEIPSPSLNGVPTTIELKTPTGKVSYPMLVERASVLWSLPPLPNNCSVEVTFLSRKMKFGLKLNGLEVIYDISYKMPVGKETIVQMTGNAWNSSLELRYRAVDCGPRPWPFKSHMEISSWNNVLKFMNFPSVPGVWRDVNFTLPFNQGAQMALWIMNTTSLPSNTVPLVQILDGVTWDFATADVPNHQLYRNDLVRRGYNVTSRSSILLYHNDNLFPDNFVRFRYAVAPTTPRIIPVIDTAWSTLTLNLTSDISMNAFTVFRASNTSCVAEVMLPDERTIRIWHGGLNGTMVNDFDNDDDYIEPDPSGMTGRFQSIGGTDIALDLSRTIGSRWKKTLVFKHRMVCPQQRLVNVSQSARSQWQYVDMTNTNGVFRIKSSSASFNGPNCSIQVVNRLFAQSGSSSSAVSPIVSCENAHDGTILASADVYPANCPSKAVVVQQWNSPAQPLAPPHALFAYRAVCDGDPAPTSLPDLGSRLVATNKEQRIQKPIVPEGSIKLWTIRAQNPGCKVEIRFDMVDIGRTAIWEESLEESFDETLTESEMSYPVKVLRYKSCSNRVFLRSLALEEYTFTRATYRQVCGKTTNPSGGGGCGKRVHLPTSRKWQTIKVDAKGLTNINSLREMAWILEYPLTSNHSEVIQVEFISIVTKSWFGWTQDAYSYGSDSVEAELHGVRINEEYPAVIKKQFLFKKSINITVSPLMLKPGDHIFTMRYRLVDWRQAKEERNLGEVLRATDKPKTLNFKIPKQFSSLTAARRQVDRTAVDPPDDYSSMEAGSFPLWLFQHHYTIQPTKPQCRIQLEFSKMDIGCGRLQGCRAVDYKQQDRLMVLRDSSRSDLSLPRHLKACSSGLGPNYFANPNKTICARLGQKYISAEGSSLTLFFRSAKLDEEYEYDLPDPEYEYESSRSPWRSNSFHPEEGNAATWGTGWTAVYRQVCAENPNPLLPTVVQATRQSKTTLPGRPKSDKLAPFMFKQWTIVPKTPGCSVYVQITLTTRSWDFSGSFFNTYPFSRAQWEEDSYERVEGDAIRQSVQLVEGPNVTLTLTNVRPSIGTPKVSYHERCVSSSPTMMPIITRKPSRSPTRKPTGFGGTRAPSLSSTPVTVSPTLTTLQLDGETCSADMDCYSSSCSMQLQRCTAASCFASCAAQQSSPALCESFSTAGCSCRYMHASPPGASACVPIS